jgi:hypothetical protein
MDGNEPRLSRTRIIQPADQRGQLVGPAGKPIDGQRTVKRLMMRKRRHPSAVSAVRLDACQSGVGRAEHGVELVPVLGRTRRSGRQGELPETFAEGVNADRRANVLADRSPVLRCGAHKEHDEPAVDKADVIVATQQMPRHLGNGGEAGCRSRGIALDWINDSEQHSNGRLWRGRAYRCTGSGKELVRRSIEVRHDWEGTTRRTDVGSSWNGVRPEP